MVEKHPDILYKHPERVDPAHFPSKTAARALTPARYTTVKMKCSESMDQDIVNGLADLSDSDKKENDAQDDDDFDLVDGFDWNRNQNESEESSDYESSGSSSDVPLKKKALSMAQ